MSKIHSSAIIGKNVEVGVDNVIGPQVIIEDNVKLGAHNQLLKGVYICSGTEIGNYNIFHMNSIIGHEPQDLAFSKDSRSYTKIGNHNVIREFVTIHRGTAPESATTLGDSNFLMAYCHVAHNCAIGNHVIMVNQASLTGHVTVEDQAFLSGMTGFHQFTKIGRLAMVSALSACNKDIPPFMTCGGRPGVVVGMNVVGMRRAGIDAEERSEIKKAYKLLYRSGLNVSQALERMKSSLKSQSALHLIEFIETSKRGILDAGAEQNEEDLETLNARKKKNEN